MIAFLTFGERRKGGEKYNEESKYCCHYKTLPLKGLALCKDEDFYVVPNSYTSLKTVGDILLVKDVYFKYLYNQHIRRGYKLEVYDLKDYPELEKVFPQGLYYFTKETISQKYLYEVDAFVYKETLLRNVYGYYNQAETVD